MADDTGSERRCGIGARLRAGRERAGMSVLQAAERLHIDPRMLEALEAEQFEVFGAPVYVRGYVRNYAELVGERSTELLELLGGSHQNVRPDLTRAPRVPKSFDNRRKSRLGVIVAVTVVLVVAVLWVLTKGSR